MWKPVPVRRSDRRLDEQEALALLEAGEWGVLATSDADGLPLATPLSYVTLNGGLYFHCANDGHKLRNLRAQPRVCFCVVGFTLPVFDRNFTTLYESTVVHGQARIVQDPLEKQRALMALCEKYLPDQLAQADDAINRSMPATTVVYISIDAVTGKAKRRQPHP